MIVRWRAETIPAVTDPASPSGLPIAITGAARGTSGAPEGRSCRKTGLIGTSAPTPGTFGLCRRFPERGEVGGMDGLGGTTSAALTPAAAQTPPTGLSSAEVAERRSRGLANEAG